MIAKSIPVLFENEEECCACGACENICPAQAISFCENESGFLYPKIDEEKCISCKNCVKVCAFKNNTVKNSPLAVYAAIAKDESIRKKSASGGVFTALAEKVIRDGGVAAGVVMDEDFNIHHSFISNADDLKKFQNSKYAQSSTRKTFSQTKDFLERGKTVLYSGTPCQIDGLLSFLKKDYNNLITADIICHGVPGNKMFSDYVSFLKKDGEVSEFVFREKKLGWGINAVANINGKKRKLWNSASPYLYYFTKGVIYRENCYKCKYADSHRPADLSLGDYWGIERQHPEYLDKKDWDETKGISLVIANTKKGVEFLNSAQNEIELKPSSFEKASHSNAQLRHPSERLNRDEIISVYKSGGWSAVENHFKRDIGLKRYKSRVKSLIPKTIKRKLKAKM